MANNARAIAPAGPGEELLLEGGGVSLCLMIDRRAKRLRIIDFRSGPNPTKRLMVQRVARREGMHRMYTVVERDEAAAWMRLGFQREGTIPGFYKRSDAFVLGALLSDEDDDDNELSGTRLAWKPVELERSPEAAYQAARRQVKAAPTAATAVRVHRASDQDIKKHVTAALREHRALTAFEPFGRDVQREHYLCTARGGFCLVASVETQPCFSNAFLELLTAPRAEKEALLTRVAVKALCDKLLAQEIVGCFAVSPVDDTALAAVFVANGFRRTGQLAGHFLLKGRRADAFLWSRKLAQPSHT